MLTNQQEFQALAYKATAVELIKAWENLESMPLHKKAVLLTHVLLVAVKSDNQDGLSGLVKIFNEQKDFEHTKMTALNKAMEKACECGHHQMVQYLQTIGVSAACNNNEPVLIASGRGFFDLTFDLIANGADFRANNDGVLRNFCYWDHLEGVKKLVAMGADIYAKNGLAFFEAMENTKAQKQGPEQVAKWLIDQSPRDLIPQPQRLMRLALESGQVQVVKSLLNKKVPLTVSVEEFNHMSEVYRFLFSDKEKNQVLDCMIVVIDHLFKKQRLGNYKHVALPVDLTERLKHHAGITEQWINQTIKGSMYKAFLDKNPSHQGYFYTAGHTSLFSMIKPFIEANMQQKALIKITEKNHEKSSVDELNQNQTNQINESIPINIGSQRKMRL